MVKNKNIKKRKVKRIIVIIFIILLLSQIVLFALSSVLDIKGKLVSVKHVSDLSSFKKIWIGNILIIEGRTIDSYRESPSRIKVEANNIIIIRSSGGYAVFWNYEEYSARYVIVYNNIFSALEAYIFNDAIDINVVNHRTMIPEY